MEEHTPKLPRLASQAWILKIDSKITKKMKEKGGTGKLKNLLCFPSVSQPKVVYIYPRGEMSILPLGQFKISKGS